MLTEMLCKGLSQIRQSEVMFDFTLKENFREKRERGIQGLAEGTLLIELHYITPTFAGKEIRFYWGVIEIKASSFKQVPFCISCVNYLKMTAVPWKLNEWQRDSRSNNSQEIPLKWSLQPWWMKMDNTIRHTCEGAEKAWGSERREQTTSQGQRTGGNCLLDKPFRWWRWWNVCMCVWKTHTEKEAERKLKIGRHKK